MRIITQEELQQLHRKSRHTYSYPYVKMVESMQKGQILFIERKEWKLKTSPLSLLGSLVNRPSNILYGMKLKMRTMEKGWVIIKQ